MTWIWRRCLARRASTFGRRPGARALQLAAIGLGEGWRSSAHGLAVGWNSTAKI